MKLSVLRMSEERLSGYMVSMKKAYMRKWECGFHCVAVPLGKEQWVFALELT